MITAFAILFWIGVAWLGLVYIGYPLLILLLATVRPSPIVRSESYLPAVTFIMAAYNEESVIGRKLENYGTIDYPRDRLRFIIGSDASTDRTDEIVRSFQSNDPTIELRRFERSGKTRIVYGIAEEVDSEIIVFCDADIIMEPDALRRIVGCFADERVGGVVVTVRYEDRGGNPGSKGERSYHGLEDTIRSNESIFYSTIGPTGQCFAVRRGSYTPLTDYRMSDDLNLAITIPLNGHRVWYEPSAVVTEINTRTLWTEYRRRVRMGQQSMATFLRYDGTRFPWSSRIAWQVWGHKVLRNLSGIPFLMVVIASAVLIGQGLFHTVVATLIGCWLLLVGVGLLLERAKVHVPLIGYPLYFTFMIVALTTGSIRALIAGGGLEMWSSPRPKGEAS